MLGFDVWHNYEAVKLMKHLNCDKVFARPVDYFSGLNVHLIVFIRAQDDHAHFLP